MHDARPGAGWWLPIAAFLALALLSVLGALALDREQTRLGDALLRQSLNATAGRLDEALRMRRSAIERFSARQAIALDEAGRASYFSADASQYLADFPTFRALAWADRDGVVRQYLDKQGRRDELVGQRLDPRALRGAIAGDGPAAADVLHASLAAPEAGQSIELVLAPTERGGEIVGYGIALIDYGRLLPMQIADIAEGSALRVRRGDQVIYARETEGPGPPIAAELPGLSAPLTVELWPAPATLAGGTLPYLLLAGGLFASGLVAVSLRLSALARRRALQAERAGHELREKTAESDRNRLALGVAERELGAIFESISDGFYTLDSQWRFVLLNPMAEQLMQRSRAELQGKVVWEVFPEVLGTVIESRFRQAVAENVTVMFEIHFPPLGTWFNARAYPYPNGLAVYFQDIGDRKRAELGLLRAQATSERAQRLAKLGSWEYDLASGELNWSDEVLRIFGMTRAQLARGLPALLERVHFEDRARLQEGQRRLHSGEGDIDIEYRVQRADGDTRIVHEMGTLVKDEHGQPVIAAGALQDITEQRRSENALRELTRRLEQSLVMNRLVMDNSLDVICAMDANGRFTQVSAASLQLWGHPSNELIGRAYIDLVHPDDRGKSLRAGAEIRTGRPTVDFRNRMISKDGRVLTVQWSAVWSQRDQLMFAVARDVTELERQSRALMDAKESLVRAQKVARMGAWELDIRSNRLTWSENVYEIFRVGPQEFEGTFDAFASRVHADDLAGLMAGQAKAVAGEADLDLEHRIVLPDGGIGYVHERAHLLRDDQGQPWRLAGSVQDVTERRRQELLLRESEQRMRTTVESALDCIISMDDRGRVIEFNPAAERTFGYRRADVIGKPLAELIVPHSLRKAHEIGLQRYLDSGSSRSMGRRLELPAVRADGSELLIELSVARLGNSEPPLFTGFLRDITEVKRNQALEAGQRDILVGVAARKPLQESLKQVTLLYEKAYPGALCSVLLLDESGKRMLTGAAPSLPPAFSLAIHGVEIGEGVGSCGTASYRGERVVVSDIEHDPLWKDYAQLALENGLSACWSTPVKAADGEVLATFATYYATVREPTDSELKAIDTMSAIAAMAIEQDRAYRRLDLSEQRFRSLFDEHPDAVYSMDMEGHFTAFNSEFRSLNGQQSDLVLGRMFDERVAPEYRETVRAHFYAAASGEARTFEMGALDLDGQRIELRVTNLPIVVEGRVTGVFGIAQDISLLRKHQRELAAALDAAEQNSQQLRRLSQSAIAINGNLGQIDLYQQLADLLREMLGAHQALVSLNADENHAQHITALSFSEKYARWRGYNTPSDGSGIYALVCETNQPLRLTQAELVAHPRWRNFGEHVAEHPPLVGWLAVPLIGSDGSNLGLLQLSDKCQGEFTEDDELIAVQFAQMASIAIERATLMEKLAVRDRFFDMSLEFFVVLDPATLRWVQVNQMLVDVTGYSAAELCSREFLEFVHPDDRPANAARARNLRDGLPVEASITNRYLCRDGSIRQLEWVSVRGPDGLVYGVGRDISDRLRAEIALRQSMTELSHRNRELQDFAFIASHDLQEPLRKIRAFSDRLQQRHASDLAPEARDYLDRTSQAAARMQTLIDDLLAYSRVARGKPFVPVNLNALVATVIEDLEARLESSGGRIECGPLPTLDGDPTQLRQLFQNVLSNALKFRDPDRPPLVSVGAIAVSVEGVPGWELRVEDNGIGFEDKYADRIFGPFQRLHGRHEYEGTGIGLAIVRRIAERHHGRIRAHGRPGQGAAFSLILPAHQATQPDPNPRAPASRGTDDGLE